MYQDSILHNKLKLLGKLTAGLLHEIRNPLSAIKLNLDLVKYYEKEIPSEVNESVDDCIKATKRIEDLIENLLSYARRSNNEREKLSLNDVTRKAIHLVNVKASKKSILLDSHLEENIPRLFLNENKLLQVLLNMITNAIDACNNKGKVNIATYSVFVNEKNYLIWEVTDDGIGISEEDQKKIFEDFYTSKPEGTGLGLTVCQSLINEMNASLDFVSEPGAGSKFSIKFEINHNRAIDDF
jgi:signal transduction histidine kinase